MEIGKLDQLITFQDEQRVADDAGGSSVTWVDGATVSASVRPASRATEELQQGARLSGVALYDIWIRHPRSVAVDQRIKWVTNDNMLLNIRSAPDPGKRAMYRKITAEQGVAM